MNYTDSLEFKNRKARALEGVLINSCAMLDENIAKKGKKFKYKEYLSFVKDRINVYVHEYNVPLDEYLSDYSAIMSVLIGSETTTEYPEIMSQLRYDVIKYLIEMGADVDLGIVGIIGVSPIGFAKLLGWYEVYDLLLENGAFTTEDDERYMTI
ncbi:MAG: hypothetical protein E7356_03600 [Clostridiales bacterium]|nr:hypothetical protein [Clostridiales bacterium]